MTIYSDEEKTQKEHFDNIADNYERHYSDHWSQVYRHRFLNKPMFEGIDLCGKKVLDAICGNGETTGFLVKNGAQVTGLDISSGTIKNYQKKWPQCETKCASILETGFADNHFDCVVVVGGLHHLHPYVSDAVTEIYRVLKPGGYFCFVEPHKGSLPDNIRQLWYKRDKLFASNEEAVDVEGLKENFSDKFNFRKQKFVGNLAYIFVLNSMILRMPLQFKKIYAPILLVVEALFGWMQGRTLSCVVVGQWKKLGP